eukprot:4521122-Amphidinium_carterae.1
MPSPRRPNPGYHSRACIPNAECPNLLTTWTPSLGVGAQLVTSFFCTRVLRIGNGSLLIGKVGKWTHKHPRRIPSDAIEEAAILAVSSPSS